jgi:hypothetical protein
MALEREIRESLRTEVRLLAHPAGVDPVGLLADRRYAGVHCFWLITTGRSGTLTLCRLLDGLGRLDACHEPFPVLFREGARAVAGDGLPEAHAARLLQVARGSLVEASHEAGRAHVDCTALMSHLAGGLRAAFAWSRFIHLVRAPRDFVCSALADGWYAPDSPFRPLLPAPPDPAWAPWQSLVWLWDRIHREGLALERRWGPFLVHRVHAEALFAGPRALEDLLVWMGGPEEAARLHRGRTAEVLRARHNASRERPTWDPAWEGFLREQAGETLRSFFPSPGRKGR